MVVYVREIKLTELKHNLENNCFKLKVSKFILVKAKSVKRIQKFSCLLSIRGVEKGGGEGKTPDLPALLSTPRVKSVAGLGRRQQAGPPSLVAAPGPAQFRGQEEEPKGWTLSLALLLDFLPSPHTICCLSAPDTPSQRHHG